MGPWGLDEAYLAPGKTITDPIHGDVYVTVLEQIFIDSEPFQRLRQIKQLGNTHLVYPGATHSRFSHSLGAVRVAQDLIDAVLDQRNAPRARRDLFAEWDEDNAREHKAFAERVRVAIAARGGDVPVTVEMTSDDLTALIEAGRGAERQTAEAVIAARLGALLHDICHIPFGHSLEDELGILTPHDKNARRFEGIWGRFELNKDLDRQLRDGGLYANLRRLILSKAVGNSLRYPFVEDIVGNTICADLLDYLERDHASSGLPIALGRRFVSAFYVMPSGDPENGQHMILNITRPDGRERTDVVTEVLKYLRYRYELSERVLVHHAKLSADAMIGKALEMWFDVLWVETARKELKRRHVQHGKPNKSFRQPAWINERDIGAVRELFRAECGSPRTRSVKTKAAAELDDRLSSAGDDTLIATLMNLPDSGGHPGRIEGIRDLARAVRDRRLFKEIGTQHRPPAGVERMVQKWGDAEARRLVEEDAARWAGLAHRWQVLVWVPPPEMRLKIADVLVDAGEQGIMRFAEYEETRRRRGADIYDAHRSLWSIGVYIHPSYRDDRLAVRRVIVRLALKMNVTFTQYERELGRQAYLWPDTLAAREAVARRYGAEKVDQHSDLVKELMDRVRSEEVQARGPENDESWESLSARYLGAEAATNASPHDVQGL